MKEDPEETLTTVEVVEADVVVVEEAVTDTMIVVVMIVEVVEEEVEEMVEVEEETVEVVEETGGRAGQGATPRVRAGVVAGAGQGRTGGKEADLSLGLHPGRRTAKRPKMSVVAVAVKLPYLYPEAENSLVGGLVLALLDENIVRNHVRELHQKWF